jgi:hypothetical protein
VNTPGRRNPLNGGVLLLFLIILITSSRGCNGPATSPSSYNEPTLVPVRNPIGEALQPDPATEYRDGIAAAILIDTSGSMRETIKEADGSIRAKIDIAQRAALNLVKQFDSYAREHSDQKIFVGIYEFSQRQNAPSCREIIKLGPPDLASAQAAISKMRAAGDTPIGDAMIFAKRDLDKSGLAKRHILVVSDGENNQGYSPGNVTQVISAQSEKDRASIYFVAFDIAAHTFDPVKDAGGVVLAASNETELTGTLDYLLSGKILVEQPIKR